MQARGGILTVEDLAGYKPIWRDATRRHFRGHDVWTVPAPAGGLTDLETLQILDARPPLGPLGRGSSATDHVLAEALKHAFADRARSLGDPDFVDGADGAPDLGPPTRGAGRGGSAGRRCCRATRYGDAGWPPPAPRTITAPRTSPSPTPRATRWR